MVTSSAGGIDVAKIFGRIAQHTQFQRIIPISCMEDESVYIPIYMLRLIIKLPGKISNRISIHQRRRSGFHQLIPHSAANNLQPAAFPLNPAAGCADISYWKRIGRLGKIPADYRIFRILNFSGLDGLRGFGRVCRIGRLRRSGHNLMDDYIVQAADIIIFEEPDISS